MIRSQRQCRTEGMAAFLGMIRSQRQCRTNGMAARFMRPRMDKVAPPESSAEDTSSSESDDDEKSEGASPMEVDQPAALPVQPDDDEIQELPSFPPARHARVPAIAAAASSSAAEEAEPGLADCLICCTPLAVARTCTMALPPQQQDQNAAGPAAAAAAAPAKQAPKHEYCSTCVVSTAAAFFDEMEKVMVRDGRVPCPHSTIDKQPCFLDVNTMVSAAEEVGDMLLVKRIISTFQECMQHLKHSRKRALINSNIDDDDDEVEEEAASNDESKKLSAKRCKHQVKGKGSAAASSSSAVKKQILASADKAESAKIDAAVKRVLDSGALWSTLCPNELCQRPFDDYKDCSSVKCGIFRDQKNNLVGCGEYFCGVCFYMPKGPFHNTSADTMVHEHVRTQHSHGSAFVTDAQKAKALLLLRQHQTVQAIRHLAPTSISRQLQIFNKLMPHFLKPDTQEHPSARPLDASAIVAELFARSPEQVAAEAGFTPGDPIPSLKNLFKAPQDLERVARDADGDDDEADAHMMRALLDPGVGLRAVFGLGRIPAAGAAAAAAAAAPARRDQPMVVPMVVRNRANFENVEAFHLGALEAVEANLAHSTNLRRNQVLYQLLHWVRKLTVEPNRAFVVDPGMQMREAWGYNTPLPEFPGSSLGEIARSCVVALDLNHAQAVGAFR